MESAEDFVPAVDGAIEELRRALNIPDEQLNAATWALYEESLNRVGDIREEQADTPQPFR